MTFEFTLEVRPEFEMPKWKGAQAGEARPNRDIGDEEINAQPEKSCSKVSGVPSWKPMEEGGYRLGDSRANVRACKLRS